MAGQEEPAQTQDVALLGGSGGLASRLGPLDLGLDGADERAGDRVGRRQIAL